MTEALPNGSRIIMVHADLMMGGAERQSLNLAQWLIREYGAHVEVWGGRAGSLVTECEHRNIPWKVVPLSWPSGRIGQVAEIVRFAARVRCGRPDALIPYTDMPNLLCGLAWRFAGARWCVWNQRSSENGARDSRLVRWAVQQSPCVVANSQYAANRLSAAANLNSSSVHVIPNGVDIPPTPVDRKGARLSFNLNTQALVGCMVANLSRRKDHATLLRAWRIVADRLRLCGRQAILMLAGRFDELTGQLRSLADELALGQSVRFLGHVTDVQGLLAAADVGVHSSRAEGLPNGVLECMGARLPVVGTDIPGIQEALGPGGALHLSAPGDFEGLAEHILALFSNPELCRRVGERNRRRVETDFSLEAMGRRWGQLLHSALGKPYPRMLQRRLQMLNDTRMRKSTMA